MPTDVPLRCTCGEVRGVVRGVAPRRVNRVLCYCDDCQAYARFLDPAGAFLDEHGASDIFQVIPVDLSIDQGSEQLGCARMTPKGVLRWYARCCRAPIANTMPTPRISFAGILRVAAGEPEDGTTTDEALGPVRGRVFGNYATGGAEGIPKRPGAGMLLRVGGKMLWSRLRHSERPSPFFDADSGRPVVRPEVLPRERWQELEALRVAAC